jgi:hypothetical protein
MDNKGNGMHSEVLQRALSLLSANIVDEEVIVYVLVWELCNFWMHSVLSLEVNIVVRVFLGEFFEHGFLEDFVRGRVTNDSGAELFFIADEYHSSNPKG